MRAGAGSNLPYWPIAGALTGQNSPRCCWPVKSVFSVPAGSRMTLTLIWPRKRFDLYGDLTSKQLAIWPLCDHHLLTSTAVLALLDRFDHFLFDRYSRAFRPVFDRLGPSTCRPMRAWRKIRNSYLAVIRRFWSFSAFLIALVTARAAQARVGRRGGRVRAQARCPSELLLLLYICYYYDHYFHYY